MPIATAPPVKVIVPSVAPGLAAIVGAAGCCEEQPANVPTLNKAIAVIMKRRIGFPHFFCCAILAGFAVDTTHNRQPVAVIGANTLDSPPHIGAAVTLLAVSESTQGKSYLTTGTASGTHTEGGGHGRAA